MIDEVQKVPALLDEVHWLIENRGARFVLCGSSARKVRRGAANLLGGRALRHELYGLVSAEIGVEFDLVRMLNHGYLSRHYLGSAPERLLRAYVNDYLKEEVAAEGLNLASIARDCGVSAPTVKEYFQILVDTLLGHGSPRTVAGLL